MNAAVDACLRQWHTVLPEGRILADIDIARYHENCLSLTRRIIAVIQPENEAEIIAIVKIANQHHIPLYTVSTGHNWGYGTSLPVADNCAILDLSRMTRIIDFDAELGLITLEPGVTQKHLADYLARHHLDFYVPTTGAGPTASIVGNALERGFGMTPEEDHFLAVTSVRAVLANGSVYQSCFAESGSANAGVWKWGIGPYVDALFAQGNIGIVTSLQIGLVLRAEHTEAYMFTIKNSIGPEQMLEACRKLLVDMRGTLGGIKILNRQQLESTIGGNRIGMNLGKDFAWMGVGVFRCRKSMISSIRKEIRRVLRKRTSRLVFINDRRNALLNRVFRLVPGKIGTQLRYQVERAEHLMDIMNGVPRGLELRLVYKYVTMPNTRPLDPGRDGVGIIWYAPVLPMKPALMHSMLVMIEEVLKKYGFPETLSFTTINEKCAIGVIPLVYKRPEGAQQAHRCFHELWERGNALGCPPYRINVEAMPQLTNQSDSVYWDSVAKIKAALDPNHILSPGRYAPVRSI